MGTDVELGRAVLAPDGSTAPGPADTACGAADRGPACPGIAVGALAVLGATAVGLRWAARPPSVRTITMGPGGWVCSKGATPPPLGPRRPWWAARLRAQHLPGT